MTDNTHQGGCLCGDIRYEGRGDIVAAHACYCRQCQKWCGGPLHSAGFADGVVVTSGQPHWFKSSAFAERGGCAKCGSALFWKFQDDTDVAVTLGSLDNPGTLPKIDTLVFVDHRPAWIDIPNNVKKMTEADCIAAFEARDSQ